MLWLALPHAGCHCPRPSKTASAHGPSSHALIPLLAVGHNEWGMVDSHEVTTMSQPSQREPAFLRRKDVQLRTGLARSTIYLYIQQGAFPKPVTLGRRAVGWLESEVSAWITERVRVARDHQREAR